MHHAQSKLYFGKAWSRSGHEHSALPFGQSLDVSLEIRPNLKNLVKCLAEHVEEWRSDLTVLGWA